MANSALDTVTRFLTEALNQNWDAALPLMTDDCVYTNVPVGTVHGPQAARAMLEQFLKPTIENTFVVKNHAQSGELLFLERVDRHRVQTGWVELPINSVFRLQDDRLAELREYFDVMTIAKQWPVPLA
ncbi:MAG TPA: limonene-1,2-epoxide hydrolase family protein [Pseudomonadales bacterium]|nr:limonene-1,2-epoxide hydrolase family protein [Pseudomonadales bacterium]